MSSVDNFIETQFRDASTSVFRDLSLNFKKIIEDGPLDEQERFLNLLAISTALENKEMMDFAAQELKTRDIPVENINEAKESAAIMAMLNTYYKFKGFLDTNIVSEHYNRAGLRMQSLMKPINGKERFEQMAFAVSVVNGCPSCISSHEKALAELGTSREKIHDIAKMAAICAGLTTLQKIS